MKVPISADLQKSYRDTLSIPDAPSYIDTQEKIVPVAVIASTNTVATASNVKLTDGTDTAAVNTDGSIPVRAARADAQSLLTGGTVQVGITATTLVQVTAGKTAYIECISITWLNPNAVNAGVLINVTDSANAEIKKLYTTISASNTGATVHQHVLVFPEPIQLQSQEKIRVVGGVAADVAFVNVIGWEE